MTENDSSKEPAPASTSEPSSRLPSGRRVLVVDDDAVVLRASSRALRGVADCIDTAHTPQEAIEMLRETEYSVVVSDYRMAGQNGIEMLDRMLRLRPETVCILASGHADLETVIAGINRVGLFRFLTKPFERDEFRAAVRQACRQFEVGRENRVLTSLLGRKNNELQLMNQRLDGEVQRRTTDLLLGLINALDLRDTETQGHSRRVALYAKRLGEQMRLGVQDLLDVERGALLHDIGKIGVSDTILLKPGKLTEEEWAEMEKHALHGYQILRSIDFLGAARLVVRNHHERFDGRGYPDGLQGAKIPVGARIFAIIDTYDAMTSDRPYRKALPAEVAHEEIRKHQDKQFDTECVAAFEDIPQRDLDEIRARVADNDDAGLE